MSGIRRVANHFNYVRSNWIVVAAGFILTLTAILVIGSLTRVGGNVLATDDYGNASYAQNGGYPANNNDYYKNGGYPASGGGDSNYYKNGGYPVNSGTNSDYYTNGGYPVTTGSNNGCHSNCGHTPTPTPTPYPRYTCNTLTATKLSERQVRFTTSASASGGAYIVGYRYEFGDGGVQDGSSSIVHTYNRGGTFTARAWVLLRVNGQQKWVTSNACTRTITLTTQNHCPYGNNGGYDNRYCTPRPTPTYTPCASCNGGGHAGNGGYYPGGGGGSVSGNDNNNQNQNSNTNNNNSSANATATANVTVNQSANPAPNVSTASTVGGSSAPVSGGSVSDQYPVMELPQTGSADAALNIIGIGSLVAAGTAYAASRKEFLQTVFRR